MERKEKNTLVRKSDEKCKTLYYLNTLEMFAFIQWNYHSNDSNCFWNEITVIEIGNIRGFGFNLDQCVVPVFLTNPVNGGMPIPVATSWSFSNAVNTLIRLTRGNRLREGGIWKDQNKRESGIWSISSAPFEFWSWRNNSARNITLRKKFHLVWLKSQWN